MNTKPKHQREGYQAYKAGKSLMDNPYTDAFRKSEWVTGWLNASHQTALVNLFTDSAEKSA